MSMTYARKACGCIAGAVLHDEGKSAGETDPDRLRAWAALGLDVVRQDSGPAPDPFCTTHGGTESVQSGAAPAPRGPRSEETRDSGMDGTA